MNFLIIPTIDLKAFDPNWEHKRKNTDGTQCIIHEENYLELAPNLLSLEVIDGEIDSISYPYPIKNEDELNKMLLTPEWNETI